MYMCKRPCFDDEYLPTFNRANVHLVDTKGKGITKITEKGPLFEGVQYELDLLIDATGFEVQKTGIYNQTKEKKASTSMANTAPASIRSWGSTRKVIPTSSSWGATKPPSSST